MGLSLPPPVRAAVDELTDMPAPTMEHARKLVDDNVVLGWWAAQKADQYGWRMGDVVAELDDAEENLLMCALIVGHQAALAPLQEALRRSVATFLYDAAMIARTEVVDA